MSSELPSRKSVPRRRALDEFDYELHRSYIASSLMADDPRMVSQAIKEVSTLRRVPCALDDNPRLGDLMRALRDLGFGLLIGHLEL